jgi:hypothetical protein
MKKIDEIIARLEKSIDIVDRYAEHAKKEYGPYHDCPQWREQNKNLRSIAEELKASRQASDTGRYDPDTQIALIWSMDDVLNIRSDLTNEQAMDVLTMVERKHDCTIGVSWETLEIWADMLFPKKD